MPKGVGKTMLHTIEEKKNWYLANFEVFEKDLNGEATSHIHTIRKDAIARFAEVGFPTTRDEEWKYTDVSPLVRVPFKPVLGRPRDSLTLREIDQFLVPGRAKLELNRLVCVNGHFSETLSSMASLPPGVRMGSLAAAMKNDAGLLEHHLARYAHYGDNAFTALSTAFLQDGIFISIPDGLIVDAPIHLLFVSTRSDTEFVSYPRVLIIVGRNCQVSFLESHGSMTDSTYLTNAVAEIVLGENAVVEYDRIQNESDRAFHVSSTRIHQARSSTFTSNAISLGGALVRNNVTAVLDGEGGECTLNGLYMAAGEQHVDNHTAIDHAKPHCASHELYKGILDGKSRAVFNGKIFVRKEAQKTDAKQTNKNLVLSDDATIDTKPQLEIFANDVKCTHGATIGQLDEDAIFYLRSRGIGLDSARDLLIYAFASDIIARVKVDALREQLERILVRRLQRTREVKGTKK